MLLPFLVGASVSGADDLFTPDGVETTVAVTAVHTAAMVAVAALVAALVFEVVGVGILRSSWIDLDRLWVGALLVGAAATLFG